MELRKKITYELYFGVLWVMYRTFAMLGVICLNGCIFQFSDHLQSGLPDLRDEFIKG
jgi:hypothetical protein